jgi:hypothetical protein
MAKGWQSFYGHFSFSEKMLARVAFCTISATMDFDEYGNNVIARPSSFC